MRRLLYVALAIAIGGAGLVIVSPALAERLLFFPSRMPAVPPPVIGGVQGVDVWFTAEDGVRLHAWWFEAAPGAPVLVHFHGNAGDIRTRLYVADAFAPRGLSVLLASYRGYGRSEGRPTEQGLYRDGEAALRFAAEKAGGPRRAALYGHSLGAAVATRVASEHDVGALILESPFTSLAEIGRSAYPFLPRILFRRLRDRLDNQTAIRDVHAPVLVIHGLADTIVPARMGRDIHERAPGRKEWFPVPGAGHNDVAFVGGAEWVDRISKFTLDAIEPPAGMTR